MTNENGELVINNPKRPSAIMECYAENKFKYDKQMLKIEFFPDGSEKFNMIKE